MTAERRAPPTLVGERVRLRMLEPRDLALIETWWEETEANVLDGGDDEGPSIQFRTSFRERVLRGAERNWFLIEGLEEGPVGYALYRIYPEEPDAAEVALRLSRQYWGRGLGGEAFRLFVRELFRSREFDRLWLTVYVANPRAIRLYEHAGFRDLAAFVDEKGLEMLKMGVSRSEHQEWALAHG